MDTTTIVNNNNQEVKKPSNGHFHEPVEDQDEPVTNTVTPPDGGWGWVIVFCSFMIHVVADGVTYTIGIFYVEFLKYFHASKGATAWVASILVGVTFCTGPIASALTNKYGCRKVAIFGSVIASFGLAISTLAPNIIFLFFSVGLCTGVGFGLMYLPAIVSVTCYFEKKRAFATGIAVCGSGFGTFALAPITEMMIERYGWQGAMLLVSGLVLHCSVFGALLRPLEPPPSTKKSTITKGCKNLPVTESLLPTPLTRKGSLTKEELPNGYHAPEKNHLVPSWALKRTRSQSDAAFSLPLLKKKSALESNSVFSIPTAHQQAAPEVTHPDETRSLASIGPIYRKDVFYSGSLMNIPEYRSNPALYTASVVSLPKLKPRDKEWRIVKFFRCSKEVRDIFTEMMDLALLGNAVFLMFGVSNFFTNIGFNVPFVYTKDRAMDMGIAEDEQASFLLAIIGISNTVGRVILGYLSDKPWVNRLYLYNASLTLCGLATALSSFCTTYPLMATYSAAFGLTAGSYVSLTSVILVDLLGLDKLTNAFGLLLVFEGIACLVGPPITGWLSDLTGTYDYGFYVCGVMIALSGLMLFAIPCMKKKEEVLTEKPTVFVNGEKPPLDVV